MADKTRYPQIPSTVWWGVRSILQRTPNATLDERLLGVDVLAFRDVNFRNLPRYFCVEIGSAFQTIDAAKAHNIEIG